MTAGMRPVLTFCVTVMLLLAGGDAFAQTAIDPGFGAAGKIMVMLLAVIFLFLIRYRLDAGKSCSNREPAPGHIRLVSTLTLGMREKLAVIDVGGQRVLIGIAQGNIRTLARLQPPAASNGGEQEIQMTRSGFGHILKRMMP